MTKNKSNGVAPGREEAVGLEAGRPHGTLLRARADAAAHGTAPEFCHE